MDTPIVSIRNAGDKPFKHGWAGQNYKIDPGKAVFVPWEAMCLWCGDPNLADTAVERSRSKAREHLGVQYGTFDAPFYDDTERETIHLPHEPFETYIWDEDRNAFRHPNIPKLEVSDAAGNRIVTILEDPDGNGAPTGRDDTDRTQEQALAQLQATVAQLQAQLAHTNPDAVAESLAAVVAVEKEPVAVEAAADMPIPEDVPPQARRGRQVSKR
jgi:hypothetical protein